MLVSFLPGAGGFGGADSQTRRTLGPQLQHTSALEGLLLSLPAEELQAGGSELCFCGGQGGGSFGWI